MPFGAWPSEQALECAAPPAVKEVLLSDRLAVVPQYLLPKQALTSTAGRLAQLSVEELRALVAEHHPAMNPLVLVDGEFFSAKRLPRKKLTKALHSRRVPAVGA